MLTLCMCNELFITNRYRLFISYSLRFIPYSVVTGSLTRE